jgi:hypothetical protein
MSQTCAIKHKNQSDASAVATKVAVLIMSDPNSGAEEALGRVFNGLAAAHDFKQKGRDVSILFLGAGTRWIGRLAEPEHPAHALYEEVKDTIAGVSCGCADVFGGAEDAQRMGLELITDNPVPGTTGLPSIPKLMDDGFTVLTF